MAKAELVNELITNKVFADNDRTALMGLSDDAIGRIVANAIEEDEESLDDMTAEVFLEAAPAHLKDKIVLAEEQTDNGDKKKKKAPPVEEKSAMSTYESVEDYLEALPPGPVRDMVVNGLNMQAEEKTRLIGAITTNKANIFKKDELEKMDLSGLKGLAALAAVPAPAPQVPGRQVHYQGAATPPPTGNAEATTQKPLPRPTVNWSNTPEKTAAK